MIVTYYKSRKLRHICKTLKATYHSIHNIHIFSGLASNILSIFSGNRDEN